MKTFDFLGSPVRVELGKYNNKRPSIQLYDVVDGVPFATATINVPSEDVDVEYVLIKNYSENAGMYEFLLRNNIIHPAHDQYRLSFNTVPVCELVPEEDWNAMQDIEWENTNEDI